MLPKTDAPVDQAAVAAFIAKWQNTPGGAERANYQLFLTEFAQALALPTAQPAAGGTLGEYQFDAPIPGGALASGGTGFADLYRQGSFVLEAKQSLIPKDKRDQPELFDPGAAEPAAASGAKYDRLMRGALAQARNYVTHLPADHPWPPFIIVCDVGRAFELYFDWAGNGRGYDFFPDRLSYRVTLNRLAEPEVQALFRDIWLAPKVRDPRLKAAEVTRTVAGRLAEVSKWLEETQRLKGHQTDRATSEAVERTSLFLMRLLFCMFAEDIGLLEKGRFTAFLREGVEDERHFENGLRELWRLMGTAGGDTRYSFVLKTDVRYFNGGLFADQQVFPLSVEARGELLVAAKQDWKNVEPAIFGTLLEQALTTTERAKLGAHYTPRPYVERLVRATIMDVLEAEWAAVQGQVENAVGRDSPADAIDALTAFHGRLTTVRVLDPACGTGNFLYVAMELLLRLEADVLDTLEKVGGHAEPGVRPRQFYGLELNPRAAVIAELVLWIGWLRWRMANDPDSVAEPVLSRTETINYGGRGQHHAGFDAVLRRTPTGEPDTGNPVPPAWPEAEFIVGNPPFIGGQDLREELGDDYAEALWASNPRVGGGADFVMQWWDRAAHLLTAEASPLRRFGFVTTNSITQEFSRRVIAHWQEQERPLSLMFAVPDHPWLKPLPAATRRKQGEKDSGPAAVRIAMTVAEAGTQEGTFAEVTREWDVATDDPKVELSTVRGRIHSNLSVGSDVTASAKRPFRKGLSGRGCCDSGGLQTTRRQPCGPQPLAYSIRGFRAATRPI